MKFLVTFLSLSIFALHSIGEPKVYRTPMTVANPVYALDVQLLDSKLLDSVNDTILDSLPDWFYRTHKHYHESDDCIQSIGNLTYDLIHTNERYPYFGKLLLIFTQRKNSNDSILLKIEF